jgi:hypothetical protein
MFKNLVQKTKTQFQAIHSGFHLFIAESKQSILIRQQPLASRTRNDFLLLQKNMADKKKLVPFMVCAVILPEVIPLLVMRGMVPSTMLTADQRTSQKEKRTIFRKEFQLAEGKGDTTEYIKNLQWTDVRNLNKYFGLSSFGTRKKLIEFLDFLKRDDEFVMELKSLTETEIQDALFLRGLPELKLNLEQLKRLLKERRNASNVIKWTISQLQS